jgi:hypothetical protein
MRFGLSVIAALIALGLIVQALGVHGSKDERSAIRHALKAPLGDLQRRDGRALCGDFTPNVEAHLVAGGGVNCESNVTRMFGSSTYEAASLALRESPARLKIKNISWHGDRASAASVYAGSPSSERHWHLEMVDGRWRIETPARLEVRLDCSHHPSGRRTCVQLLSMRFVQP